MEEKKKKKKKKGAITILVPILVPIIILVVVASAFFAIIDAIFGFISAIITTLIEILDDPILFIYNKLIIGVNNFVAQYLGGSYAAPERKKEFLDVYIGEEQFIQLKENMKGSAIVQEEIGLTDDIFSKMYLASIATYATVDTIVYMPVLNYSVEFGNFKIDGEDVSYLNDGTNLEPGEIKYFIGNKLGLGQNKEIGDAGRLYIGVRGTVIVLNDDNEELKYYDQETIQQILADYKKAVEDRDHRRYIDSFKKVFREIYTIPGDSLGNIIAIGPNIVDNLYDSSNSYDFINMAYKDAISLYGMPLELLVSLLNITASPDFIEDVVDLVGDTEIKIRVNETTQETSTLCNNTITLKEVADVVLETPEGTQSLLLSTYEERY